MPACCPAAPAGSTKERLKKVCLAAIDAAESGSGLATQHYRIGGWTFRAGENELVQGGERRRLEDRAARTLELLCRRAGEAVGQDEIIAQVWNGRSQSPNSIPVVIGQLRRALGDDARSPRFIETVPKRGYRLVARGVRDRWPGRSRRPVAMALL